MLAPAPTRSTKPVHRDSVANFVAHVRDWLRTCAHAYTAAQTYEELRHLSDAELSRRGLSRATLASDLIGNQEQRREH